jgi:hypothetical protein
MNNFRPLHSLVAYSLLAGSMGALVACGGGVDTSDSTAATLPDATDGSAPSSGGNVSSGGALGQVEAPGGQAASPLVCDGDGDVQLVVQGSVPDGWQGRAVYVSAIENEAVAGVSARRVALLSTSVDDGAFTLSCPGALHENYYYPSVAVFVDVDGDGACTSADAGYQLQLYGWGVKVAVDLSAEDWQGPNSLRGPIGNEAATFCAGYFADLGGS